MKIPFYSWTAVVLVLAAVASAAPRRASIEVRFAGEAIEGLTVGYFDGERTLRSTTNAHGVVVFDLKQELSPWNPSSLSEDYVLRDLRGDKTRWTVNAVRSARWRQRNHPRPCDAWRSVMDIPRGSLSAESADDYDQWYASLSERSVANCVALASLEAKVGSKAPWYLYELKGLPSGCVDGVFTTELDWTAWYRRLLEEATGATPGKCLSDWDRWWASKGYPPVPERAEDGP